MSYQPDSSDQSFLYEELSLSPTIEEMRILAVDDDHMSMEFLNAQCRNLGHQIIKAENGQQALDILKVRHDSIDIILMDREMPVMDGLTCIKHIKNSPDLRSIPIVMVILTLLSIKRQKGYLVLGRRRLLVKRITISLKRRRRIFFVKRMRVL